MISQQQMKWQNFRSWSQFFARQSPERTSVSFWACSRTLPLSHWWMLTFFSPSALFSTWTSDRHRKEFSLFLSFGQAQRGGTPVEFTLWQKKKKAWLHLSPPFLLFNQGHWHLRSSDTPNACCQYLVQKLWTSWEGPSLNFCCLLHPPVLLFLKC